MSGVKAGRAATLLTVPMRSGRSCEAGSSPRRSCRAPGKDTVDSVISYALGQTRRAKRAGAVSDQNANQLEQVRPSFPFATGSKLAYDAAQ